MSGIGVALVVVVLALVVAGAGFVLYQLMRQQGRMLLRIDEIERVLGIAGGHGHLVMAGGAGAAPSVPLGLPVGSALEPFTLSDLDGRPVALDDFRGRQVILLNWSPTCGFCDRIGPEVAAAGRRLEAAGGAVLLLAHGDADTNRALAARHGIASPIVRLGEANPAGFQSLGTPAAFLVDAEGKVATTLAIGADQVALLLEDVTETAAPNGSNGAASEKRLRGQRNLSESRLVRDGLKAGTAAPAFTLPDLDGNPVSLDDFRGRRLLLTFSDPDCGPCDALAPHLARIHREHRDNDLAVVLVGRGGAEQNRKKAEEFGFEFPVVLQEGWKLSREYGIFATPVAFLIDERGTIAHDVARGVDEILALVPSSQPAL